MQDTLLKLSTPAFHDAVWLFFLPAFFFPLFFSWLFSRSHCQTYINVFLFFFLFLVIATILLDLSSIYSFIFQNHSYRISSPVHLRPSPLNAHYSSLNISIPTTQRNCFASIFANKHCRRYRHIIRARKGNGVDISLSFLLLFQASYENAVTKKLSRVYFIRGTKFHSNGANLGVWADIYVVKRLKIHGSFTIFGHVIRYTFAPECVKCR